MELQTMNGSDQEVHNVINNNDWKDHSQGVGSLPIMSTDYATKETMLEVLSRSSPHYRFLKITASYWPMAGTENAILHKCWFIFIRLVFAGFVVYNFYYVINSIVFYNYLNIIAFMTNVLGFGSVVPAQYLNQLRLQQPAHFQDSAVLDESRKVAKYYGLICTATLLVSLLFLGIGGSGYFVFLLVGSQFAILLYLTFNMLFLILDLKASSLLLDQLHILADNEMLDMQKFKMVRSDIHRRVEASRWASDIIIAPCILSVILIAVLINLVDSTANTKQDFYLIGIVCIMLKEILFIMVAFRYVANVNGKADELTVKLSKDMYCADPQDVKQLLPDIQRVSVHASSISEPITFPLLFKRVSWENVMVSAAGFVATILASIIQSIVKV